jgi:hypothetical protein
MAGKAITRTGLTGGAATKKSAEELKLVMETLKPAIQAREEETRGRLKV